MKKVLMGLIALVMCLSSFKANAQLSRYLNEQQIFQLTSNIAKDNIGRIIGLDYGNLYEEIGHEKFVAVVFELTNSKFIFLHSNECGKSGGYTYNKEAGTVKLLSIEEAGDLQEAGTLEIDPTVSGNDPTAHIFMDKKNWRRPGCKGHRESICILYF